jgi:hypothetical protein
LTENQVSYEYVLAWIRERLEQDCEQYERSGSVLCQLDELKLTVMDVLHVLRNATTISGLYEGGCFVVRGLNLDGQVMSVVVAPPSAKNRVRVVKIWID